MKKLSVILALALSLCGCALTAQQQSQLNTVAAQFAAFTAALNAASTTLPGACATLSSAVTQIQNTPNLPASIAQALGDGNAKYSSYCVAGASITVAASVAVTDINAFIQSLQAASAAAAGS